MSDQQKWAWWTLAIVSAGAEAITTLVLCRGALDA